MIRRPSTILALLTALNLLNYLDRLVISAVLAKLRDELHLSDPVAGALGTVFLLGYFVTSPIFGALADKGPRKRLIAAGVAVWSAATYASGLARSAFSMFAARAVVGVGEASYATLAPTVIDDVAPPDRKARWLSVFYVAMPLGGALGYLVGGFVAKHYGWRHAFFVAGGPGLVLALLCLLVAEPARRNVAEKPDILGALRKLWPLLVYRRAVLGYAAYTFAIGGFSFWAPTFLMDRYHLDVDVANFRFGIVTVLGGAIGTALGGAWADASLRRARATDDATISRVNLRVCAIGALAGAPLAAACFLAPTASAFFALAFFAEIALFLVTSPINVVILRAVPSEIRPSAMALSIFAIHLLGDLWSPLLLGFFRVVFPSAGMLAIAVAIAVGAYFWRAPRRALA